MQTYSEEFKIEVVKRIIEGKESAASVAREVGVNANTVYNWVSKYKEKPEQPFVGKGKLRDEDEEVRVLKKLNRDLKEENEILKKAAAYFAKNQK